MPNNIAFCFLVYDHIHLEELWWLFFQDIDPALYRIYVHWKPDSHGHTTHTQIYPYLSQLPGFHVLPRERCVPTSHASLSLVQAQNILLEEALSGSPHTSHMVFLSQSCIPLKSFAHVYGKLVADGNRVCSYFNQAPASSCLPRCASVLPFLADPSHLQKASQWCILHRDHADMLVSGATTYMEWFQGPGGVPDEHAYITWLYAQGRQSELCTTPNLSSGATTFTYWPDMKDYRFPDARVRRIKEYESISEEELLYLVKEAPCLFGRKFLRTCLPYLYCCDAYLAALMSG